MIRCVLLYLIVFWSSGNLSMYNLIFYFYFAHVIYALYILVNTFK